MHTDKRENPFQSFWMAGYECSDKLNSHRERVDLINLTGHLTQLDSDYQLLQSFGISTVREGIRWSFVEVRPYNYDWTTVERMIRCGLKHNIQQLWDICHFGFPTGLSPLDDDFTPRLVHICKAFVVLYRSLSPDSELIVTPINEVSFLSWLGGDAAGTVPYQTNNGWEIKYHLMKAFIAAVAAMREIDPTIRILTTEPLVDMVPELPVTLENEQEAFIQNERQFQSVEMLCGNICPELGGKPEYLDILGFNFYYNNRWVINDNGFIPWVNETDDPRWRPLSDILFEVYNRYQKPFVISETSHSGDHRPDWMSSIAEECSIVLSAGLPLWGVCLYPIIDRPDWDDLSNWHHSGLWDSQVADRNKRVRYEPYAKALLKAMESFNEQKR
ncbi:amine oxidase [Mucilaginibacter sp.]|uniref:amine oxidase n=1 Tax=Mucilaginibacter sp. TaxID=1882438 RepID=UPI0035BC3F88